MDKKITDILENIISSIAGITPAIEETAPIGIINFNKWEWTQGVGLFTLWQYYLLSKNTKAKEIVQDWFTARFAEGLPPKNINTMCPMLTLAFLYEETKAPEYLPYIHEWAEYALRSLPRTLEGGLQHIVSGVENRGQLWDDTLYMTVLFLAKYGKLFDKPEYVEESEYQFLLHIKYLTDRASGLWYHGWSFERGDNFACALWARGNSWITAGVPEYLEIAKPQGAVRRMIVNAYLRQVEALSDLQDKSGLWHTLLDDPESYLESSASANFAYGIIKGIRCGILDRKYFSVAEQAIAALIECVDKNGVVGKVSYGTGMGETLEFYKEIPVCPMPYGQTLPALAFMQYLEYKKGV